MKQIAWSVLSLAMVANVGFAADCKNDGSTVEIKQCEDANFNQADRELNNVYGKLLNRLDAEGQRKLKTSQRAWLKFRDSNAEFIADSNRGGSIEPIIVVDTKTQMTQARTRELQEVYGQLTR